MEHRRHFIHELNIKIKQLNHYNKKDVEKIERFSAATDDFCIKHIKNAERCIRERDEEIIDCTNRIKMCREGKLDDTFKAESNKNKQEAEQHRKEKSDKYRLLAEDKKQKTEELHAYYKKQRDEDRQFRTIKKEVDRAYRYYINVTGSIPEHLLKKLKDMPNNKGYIYRGRGYTFRGEEVTGDNFLYGQKPAEKNKPITMFEKNRNILYIHEWGDTYYKLFEKVGKNRKELVRHDQRKKKIM